ncbi:peroxiredoxin [Actinoalloteichus sp. AHMU CJ021]|uniref:Organic hydroperoxide reductase OsmC/OhrA n=1 Tax=Actinoalloteichus caeruleus DSM 43889 TaxID=1120930 RepID=A0ABT1JDB6_ACTCY|nr:OsmC family protein [Actinoalloteichus caeruleus]AUS81016.1 peroxiredoxin [Actinoalloteichus sp. AHMU CJ021]MCP2330488.1 Organic hydroperoxide reductase OsmC/OhrA [Actinoalloteichus caeruleus DSM 43889]
MSKEHHYAVTVRWTPQPGQDTSSYRTYTRDHDLVVEGKPVLQGSADPSFRGDQSRWNPEEFLVGALSECHLLTYLALCATQGVVVTSYEDAATGLMRMERVSSGRFVEVVLNPVVTVTDASMVERAEELHAAAHRDCFIANSVNFPVRHQPTIRVAS